MQLLMHVNAASGAAQSRNLQAGRVIARRPVRSLRLPRASNAGRSDYNVTRASEKATVNIFGY